MTYDRPSPKRKIGRVFWSLFMGFRGCICFDGDAGGVKDACASAAKRALPQVHTLKDLRGQAYALIGLGLIAGAESEEHDCQIGRFTRRPL